MYVAPNHNLIDKGVAAGMITAALLFGIACVSSSQVALPGTPGKNRSSSIPAPCEKIMLKVACEANGEAPWRTDGVTREEAAEIDYVKHVG